MEGQTEFELERAIAAWRASLTRVSSTEIDELADHLREEFKRLQALGLAEDEAWLLATRRLGSSRAIETEFAKLEGARGVLAFLVGYLTLSVCVGIVQTLITAETAFAMRSGTSALVALASVYMLVGGILIVRWLPRLAVSLPERVLRSSGWSFAAAVAWYALSIVALRFGTSQALGAAFGRHDLEPSDLAAWMRTQQLTEAVLPCVVCAIAWILSRRARTRPVAAPD